MNQPEERRRTQLGLRAAGVGLGLLGTVATVSGWFTLTPAPAVANFAVASASAPVAATIVEVHTRTGAL